MSHDMVKVNQTMYLPRELTERCTRNAKSLNKNKVRVRYIIILKYGKFGKDNISSEKSSRLHGGQQ